MAKQDPNEVVHVQVKPGQVVVYGEHAFGDRATLQVKRSELASLGPAKGYEVLESGADVPDVAER
jgi:hypothetical protein